MRTRLKAMRIQKNGITEDILHIFGGIIQSYSGDGCAKI